MFNSSAASLRRQPTRVWETMWDLQKYCTAAVLNMWELCCNKIAEAEAAVSVNEKKWLVMHVHVQLKLDDVGAAVLSSSSEHHVDILGCRIRC